MRFIHEVARRIRERNTDPRREKIERSAGNLHAKFEDLCEPALGHVLVGLTEAQSERILPSAQGADPFRIQIVLFGPGIYSCILNRGGTNIQFVLDENDARVSRIARKENPDIYEALHDPYKSTDLEREDAHNLDRKLQALEFGHNMVDVLLEVRGTSPRAFHYV